MIKKLYYMQLYQLLPVPISGHPVITEKPALLIDAKKGDYVSLTCNAEGQ